MFSVSLRLSRSLNALNAQNPLNKCGQFNAEQRSRPLLHAFDGEGDTLANTNAHGSQSATAVGFLQLVNGSKDQSCAAHAERMAQRDGAAVGIYMRSIIG